MVPAKSVGMLIGRGGQTVRALRTAFSKVRVDYPPPNAKPPQNGKLVAIKLAGPREQAEEVKAAINDLLKFYHSEATHPGATHIEFDVPEENLGKFIGRGSSNIRHVQGASKAEVHVPRDWSLNKNVVVVGLPHEVAHAKKHIDRILQDIKDAETARQNSGTEEGEGDGDEDEEPVEEWAKEYMYNRR